MRLFRRLVVGDAELPTASERVRLALSTPGAAEFVVADQSVKVGQPVLFDLWWGQNQAASRLFDGFVQSVTRVDGRQQVLLCREWSAVLNQSVPLNLRHVSLPQVLAEIGRWSGLSFAAGEGAYSRPLAANFFSLGSGVLAMRSLASVFAIPDFVWQQQGERTIYAGAWADSRWASRPVEVPEDAFEGSLSNGSASIAAIPQLRPGVQLNGRFVRRLLFSGERMELTWTSRFGES